MCVLGTTAAPLQANMEWFTSSSALVLLVGATFLVLSSPVLLFMVKVGASTCQATSPACNLILLLWLTAPPPCVPQRARCVQHVVFSTALCVCAAMSHSSRHGVRVRGSWPPSRACCLVLPSWLWPPEPTSCASRTAMQQAGAGTGPR